MNRCPSTFYGVQCGKWADHDGSHTYIDSSDHVTAWDDAAADGSAA